MIPTFNFREHTDLLTTYDALLPEWTPFEPIPGYNGDGEAYHNSRYVVIVRRHTSDTPDAPVLAHLSIHDHDRTTRHAWRDFQRIKNELCGVDWEAIEFYPPDRYLVDAANQYHLWCFSRSVLIDGSGIGFRERFVKNPADGKVRQ